jgi:hypothetical protein
MRDEIAIVENVQVRAAEVFRDAHRALVMAEAEERRAATTLQAAQQASARARVALGVALLEARKAWPQRGPRAKGWGEMLASEGIDDATAWRYMRLAEAPGAQIALTGERNVPTYGELGLAGQRDVPAPGDADAPPDRNTWCTPKWIADAIGHWGLDPCSNERSHVQSTRVCRLDRGQDGLALADGVAADVMPWVLAYGHTRFCFLVKFDPSTKWCAELLAHTELVLFPKRTRIEFEPPPGVPGDGGNQFPHGLFFARAEDATAEIRAACFEFHVPRAAA